MICLQKEIASNCRDLQSRLWTLIGILSASPVKMSGILARLSLRIGIIQLKADLLRRRCGQNISIRAKLEIYDKEQDAIELSIQTRRTLLFVSTVSSSSF